MSRQEDIEGVAAVMGVEAKTATALAAAYLRQQLAKLPPTPQGEKYHSKEKSILAWLIVLLEESPLT
jgi:hypothetical protein